MLNLLLILVSFSSGIIVRVAGLTSANAHKGINVWILNIALPAVFLRYLPYITWGGNLLLPAVSPVIVWFCGCVAVNIFSRFWPLSPTQKGAFKLTAGLSNTSFLGFIAVYYSQKDVSIAIVYDEVSFILLATAGLVTALRNTGTKPTARYILYRLITFPPFVACALAFILPCFADISGINPLLDRIAGTIGPLALFSIGMQLSFSNIKSNLRPLLGGLAYKHLIAPGIILLIAALMGQHNLTARISIFQAAMPTLATAAVLADDTGLDARLAYTMVGIGTVLSFLTTALWWWVLK